jgi:hypothetical protein
VDGDGVVSKNIATVTLTSEVIYYGDQTMSRLERSGDCEQTAAFTASGVAQVIAHCGSCSALMKA